MSVGALINVNYLLEILKGINIILKSWPQKLATTTTKNTREGPQVLLHDSTSPSTILNSIFPKNFRFECWGICRLLLSNACSVQYLESRPRTQGSALVPVPVSFFLAFLRSPVKLNLDFRCHGFTSTHTRPILGVCRGSSSGLVENLRRSTRSTGFMI